MLPLGWALYHLCVPIQADSNTVKLCKLYAYGNDKNVQVVDQISLQRYSNKTNANCLDCSGQFVTEVNIRGFNVNNKQ